MFFSKWDQFSEDFELVFKKKRKTPIFSFFSPNFNQIVIKFFQSFFKVFSNIANIFSNITDFFKYFWFFQVRYIKNLMISQCKSSKLELKPENPVFSNISEFFFKIPNYFFNFFQIVWIFSNFFQTFFKNFTNFVDFRVFFKKKTNWIWLKFQKSAENWEHFLKNTWF